MENEIRTCRPRWLDLRADADGGSRRSSGIRSRRWGGLIEVATRAKRNPGAVLLPAEVKSAP